MKEDELGNSTCNIETDRIDAQQMQFHKLEIDHRVLCQTTQMHHLLNGLNAVYKTPNATTSKHFAFPQPEQKEPKSGAEVNFSGLALMKLPANFLPRYAQAKSLDLRENLFIYFPIEIPRLFSLRILRLDDNKISAIPAEISSLVNLQILTASKNCIQFIEPGIGKLVSLTALVLNDNQISEWPAWVCTLLPKLKLLHLHNNPNIACIPLAVHHMESLTELSLDWLLYLNPPVGKTLKGAQGQLYIQETKSFCKMLEQRSHPSHKCGFFDFLQHFMGVARANPAPKLYPKDRTPFHIAAMHGHTAIVSEYMKSAIDYNAKDAEGSTAFALALRNNRDKVVKLMMGSDKLSITASGDKHGSPLHIAVLREQFEVARKIIAQKELDTNARDMNGNTALHYLFVKFDSDPATISRLCGLLVSREDCALNLPNTSLLTPLHCAAKNSQDTALRFALKFNETTKGNRRFDFGVTGGRESAGVVHYVAMHCNIETLEACLRKEKIDVLLRDKFGRSARDYVINSAAGKLLLKYERRAILSIVSKEGVDDDMLGGSVIATARTSFEMKRNEEITHNEFNRAIMQQSIMQQSVEFTRGSECCEVTEIESPVDIVAYTTNPPSIFEELHRMNLMIHDLHSVPKNVREDDADKDVECGIQINDTIFEREEKRRPPQSPKVMAPCSPSDHRARRKHSHNLSQPRVLPKPSVLLSKTYKGGTLCLLTQESVLSHNRFAPFYRLLMQGETARWKKCRMLYRMFREHVSDSEEMFILLCNQLKDSNPVKGELVYLLGMMMSRKAIKSLDRVQAGGQAPMLVQEVVYAKRNVKAGKNYFPVKYGSKTPDKGHVMSNNDLFQTQIVVDLKKSGDCKKDMGGTNSAQRKHKGRQIQCVPINKTGNYFDINSQ